MKARFQPGHVKLDPDGLNEEGEAADPRHLWHAAIAKRVGEHLEIHYPGHPWRVECPVGQGIVRIQLPIFMRRYWMVIKLHELDTDPGLRSITRAGGEILERYQLPRASFDLCNFLALKKRAPQIHLCANGWIPD